MTLCAHTIDQSGSISRKQFQMHEDSFPTHISTGPSPLWTIVSYTFHTVSTLCYRPLIKLAVHKVLTGDP